MGNTTERHAIETGVSPAVRTADEMIALECPACRLSLYMPTRKLQMRTWQCPACLAIIENP